MTAAPPPPPPPPPISSPPLSPSSSSSPSLDHLDKISPDLPVSRQRVYTEGDLEVLNLLEMPAWVFDVRAKAMHWANDEGVILWSAHTREELMARDFATDMSKASERVMLAGLERFHRGSRERLTWTFHPNFGKDGPKTCELITSGIYVWKNDKPYFCMLVIADKITHGGQRSPEEKMVIRRTEMLKHFPIIARQFSFQDGQLMDQNPEALAVFGTPSDATHYELSMATVGSSAAYHIAISAPTKHTSSSAATATAPAPAPAAGAAETSTSPESAESESASSSPKRAKISKTLTTPLSPSLPLLLVPEPPSCTNHFLAQFVDLDEGMQVWEELKEGHDYSMETLQYTLKGKSWFSIDVRQILDPVTSEKAILFSARDISKLMKYAQEQAEQQNIARSEFFAVMAHEIRTPLHQVIGSIELLEQRTTSSSLDEEQQDCMQVLRTSSSAMMAIINDALDFSKLEAGKFTLENIQFKIRGVIQGCVAAVQQQAEKHGLRIRTDIQGSIPEYLICDPNRLRQILLNILSNAVKFSADKGGTIEVKVRRRGEEDVDHHKAVLFFSVQDPGVGISQSKQQIIFDAYKQAESSVSRKYGGTGLGLSICKSLAKLMGGEIGVESELGQGSTFWFQIPFSQYMEEPTTTTSTHRSTNKDPGRSPAATGGRHGDDDDDDDDGDEEEEEEEEVKVYHVLVAEDNKINVKIISKMLQRLGHNVTVAENGQVALDAIQECAKRNRSDTTGIHCTTTTTTTTTTDSRGKEKKNGLHDPQEMSANAPPLPPLKFDVVLMDWQMPVMDGIEATKAIRSQFGYSKADLPVIGLTASIQGRDWLDVGMNECLKKPLRINELKSALSRNVGKIVRRRSSRSIITSPLFPMPPPPPPPPPPPESSSSSPSATIPPPAMATDAGPSPPPES